MLFDRLFDELLTDDELFVGRVVMFVGRLDEVVELLTDGRPTL